MIKALERRQKKPKSRAVKFRTVAFAASATVIVFITLRQLYLGSHVAEEPGISSQISNSKAAPDNNKHRKHEPPLVSTQIFEGSAELGKVVSKPYRVMNDSSWCSQNAKSGLLFVKIQKTGSTTMKGVVMRIAANASRRLQKSCHAEHSHGMATEKGYASRNKSNSYLFSIVRDPAKRLLSHFFFSEVTKRREEPTDENFMSFVGKSFSVKKNSLHRKSAQRHSSEEGGGGYQLQYLTTRYIEETLERSDPLVVHQAVSKVLTTYDFVAVMERMDESLVAFSFLLGIPPGDILHFDSKVAKDESYTWACESIAKSFLSPTMKEYFESDDWMEKNVGDHLLYEAVNRRLDATIDFIGKPKFQKALVEYRELTRLAKESCGHTVRFSCKKGSKRKEVTSKCYTEDIGCGYECLDQLVLDGAVTDRVNSLG